jgi:hypothetical protein
METMVRLNQEVSARTANLVVKLLDLEKQGGAIVMPSSGFATKAVIAARLKKSISDIEDIMLGIGIPIDTYSMSGEQVEKIYDESLKTDKVKKDRFFETLVQIGASDS